MRPEQEPGPDELLAAAQFGNLGAVERLVDSGMDVNAYSTVRQPLMMAVGGGDKHMIVLQMLLNGGSETSFHHACYDPARLRQGARARWVRHRERQDGARVRLAERARRGYERPRQRHPSRRGYERPRQHHPGQPDAHRPPLDTTKAARSRCARRHTLHSSLWAL